MNKHTIYGLHLSTDTEIRYVGRSTRPANERLRRHIRDVNAGSMSPVHVWMREVGIDNVQQIVLEVTTDGPAREAAWCLDLMNSGNRLTNVHDPSNSPATGWTSEQREALKGTGNPFHGRTHSEESKAKMRAARRPKGKDHPLYGRKQDPDVIARRTAKAAKTRWTPEAREAQRQKMLESNPFSGVRRTGEDNAFFGKKHTEETRAKMSEAAKNRAPFTDEHRAKLSAAQKGKNTWTKGRPAYNKGVPMSEEQKKKVSESKRAAPTTAAQLASYESRKGQPARGPHIRWHLKRGVTNPDCVFCSET